MQFQKGDLVRLKSGGPVMTVNVTHPDGSVNTAWFSGKKLETGYFEKETLNLAPSDTDQEEG